MVAHRVVALVTPPQSSFELGCAAAVFRDERYRFGVCTERPGAVRTLEGFDMIGATWRPDPSSGKALHYSNGKGDPDAEGATARPLVRTSDTIRGPRTRYSLSEAPKWCQNPRNRTLANRVAPLVCQTNASQH